jgi:hypothetical protein
MQRVHREVQEAAGVYELHIAVAQAPGRIATANADVIVHPEGDVASEVSGHENAEQSGLKIGGRDELRNGVGSERKIIEVVPIAAGDLKEVVFMRSPIGGRPGMVPGQMLFGHISFCAGAPSITGGTFRNVSSSFGNLKPLSLNAFPKSFSFGKSMWQVLQEV